MNPYLSQTLLPLFTVTILSIFFMYQIGIVARKINLIDNPGKRKQHHHAVPVVGGISIFLAVSFSLLFVPFGLGDFRYLIFSLGLIVVVGVLDDHSDISPYMKITMQFIVALIILTVDETLVRNIGDILNWNDGNALGLGWLAYPLTVVAIVGIINAFNMADGHDGVSSCLFLLTAGSLILLCTFSKEWKFQYFLGLFFASTAVFLFFNLSVIVGSRRQIFLGDAGSMVLGLFLVYSLIKLSQSGNVVIKTTSAPWIMGLPLFDMLAVITLRIGRRVSPFVADRKHIHHLLTELEFSKYQILAILVIAQMVFCSIGVLGTLLDYPDWTLFWSFIVVSLAYISLSYFLSIGKTIEFK